MNVAEYVNNKTIRDNLPFTILPSGESYYTFNGEKISPDRLEKLLPITVPIVNIDMKRYKGENSDRTKNWFYDKKSY